MRSSRLAICVFAASILAACTVGPSFIRPNEPVPTSYAGARARADGAPVMVSDMDPSGFWWREFSDPQLDLLEEQVASGNLDLKAAYLRIVEARMQTQAARAQGLPSLDASAAYTREQLGLTGILKSQHVDVGPGASATEAALIRSIESPVNLYQLGFDSSWELDLFGKVRRSVEAANAQAQGVLETRNDLLVSLQAEVAQTYFELRAGQLLHQVTVDQITAQRDVFELTLERRKHGLAAEADVDSAQAQLSALQSQLPPYDKTIETSRHALAVLTGQPPQALDAQFDQIQTLPALPQSVPIGLPSTLARRRPDIRKSEAALHTATAQVGVSVASLFPDVALTGTAGLRNLSPGYLFDWDSHFYTVGPSVSIPIFHGGELTSQVRLSKAAAAEAALNYRKTVLNALQEIEDAMSDLRLDTQRTASLKDSVTANHRALEVDLNSYRHGLITYLTVLTVQLQEVQSRQQLTSAALQQSIDLIKLYKALGGGWEDQQATASTL